MINTQSRPTKKLSALAVGVLLTACSGLLDVTNPSAITEDNLAGDAQTVNFMMNGVIGEFRREYAWLAAHGAMFTDEAIQGHPWAPWNVYDQRNITPESPAYDGLSYQLLQRARGTADELIPKMELALGTAATSSIELARAYAYGGYSYLMIADFMCSAPINVGVPVPSAQLYQEAIIRFQKAIDIATAGAAKTGASDVLNLAKVAKARAHLNRAENADAITAATGVPAGFTATIRYSTDAADWQVYNFMNWFAGYRFPGELDLALDPAKFASIADARIPFDPVPRRLGNGVRDGLLAYQSPSYSEHAPGGTVTFSETAAIRFASGLEAQYIIAEAGGMTPAALRSFIDARRGVGGQGNFGGTDAQLFNELLEQRFRDFFLDGHRMGDLRRYKARYALDFWPTGQMPGLTQNYGTQECWPIAASERNSNPNVP
jgi:hypothetical protein